MQLVLLQRGVKELGLAGPGWLIHHHVHLFNLRSVQVCRASQICNAFAKQLHAERQLSVLPRCAGTDLVDFPRGCAEKRLRIFCPVSVCWFLMRSQKLAAKVSWKSSAKPCWETSTFCAVCINDRLRGSVEAHTAFGKVLCPLSGQKIIEKNSNILPKQRCAFALLLYNLAFNSSSLQFTSIPSV